MGAAACHGCAGAALAIPGARSVQMTKWHRLELAARSGASVLIRLRCSETQLNDPAKQPGRCAPQYPRDWS